MTSDVSDVLALIQGPENVGDQWRVIRPFARLLQAGVNARWFGLDTTESAHAPTDPERTVLVVRLLAGSDEATIDRWLATWRPGVRAVVYEMDDVAWGPALADHLVAAEFTQGRTRDQILRAGEMARYFASRCDGVIVSSEPLAAMVRADVDVPVVVVPNAIDIRWFRSQLAIRPVSADRQLTIGWCGGRRPEADLAPMAAAWGRIAKRHPSVRFVVAGPAIPDVIYREVDDARIVRLPWVAWADAPMLYQVDIGCCSVADTPFSRAKTPIKCWEYALAGAQVVGSRLLYGDCCLNGTTRGYVATTADDWELYLDFLVRTHRPEDQSDLQLVRHVEREHGLDVQLHRWTDAYRAIAESRAGVSV